MDTKPVHAHVHTASTHGVRWLRSKYAGFILALISFAESVFLPVLIDPFLIALILAKRSRWLYYTTISIAASVAGGAVAYYLGLAFFDTLGQRLINFYSLEAQFASISKSLDSNGFVFVLIGAITPIPYKLVALASGFGQISFVTFLFASIFGRIIRLGLVGYVAYAIGPHAVPLFRKHLLSLAYVFLLILAVYLGYKLW